MSLPPEDRSIVEVRRRVMRILDSRRPLRRRLSALACAFLVGAGILTLPHVRAQDRSSGKEAVAKKPVAGEAPAHGGPAAASGGAEDPGRTTRGLDLLVVNSRTGRPEPGVSIESPQISGKTDERGRYLISWTSTRPAPLWFNVRKPGFVHLQVNWDNSNPSGPGEIPREYTIELEPGSDIGGIVQDEEGQPIVGASVIVSGGTSDPPRPGGPRIHGTVNHQTRTDAAGRWKCDGIPDRIHLSLRITHPDYAVERNPSQLSVYNAKELAELRAGNRVTVLHRGATIVGQVRGGDGQPVVGAEISLSGTRERSWKTDAAGRFRLEHLAPGPNELIIRAKGHVPATRAVVAGRDTGPIEVRLENGRSVSGTVVDHMNKPIPGAMVRFEIGYGDADNAPMVTADAHGRFRLDGVPDDPGSLTAARPGTLSRVTRPLSPSESDVTVVLPTFAAIVQGNVTDAETGRPVPSFALVMDGCQRGRRASVDGHFKMEWVNWTLCKDLHVAIEADGYAFTEWRTVPAPSGKAEITVDFRLKKAAPVVCIVRAADGSLLPDAEIGTSSSARDAKFPLQFRIVDAHLQPNTNTYAPMKTDPGGRFTLAPREESYSVVVAHQRGFAVLKTAPIRGTQVAPAEITLQPWGRIEGTLRVGNKPGVHERITLDWSEPTGLPVRFVHQLRETTTDDDGRFAFDRLLPGTWRVSTRMARPIPAVQVDPGQVTRLVLGGTGRPVIGRLAIPDDIKTIPEKRVLGALSSRVETTGRPEIGGDEVKKRRKEEQHNDSRSFGFTPQPDGSFRLEDIPPGSYEIWASCYEQISEGQGRESRMVGLVRRMITVPEIAGGKGYSEEPFDMGTLTLEPFLGVGQPAPEFRVTALDGKPIRLSDFRGKHVLVVFWGPHQRGGLEESRALRSLLKYKSFTSGERLVILGVCIGASSLEEARVVSSQRGWDWLNAVEDVSPRDGPRVETSDSLRARYNLPFRSSVWLIGADGEILGRDLRGDAIKAAAATVLRAK